MMSPTTPNGSSVAAYSLAAGGSDEVAVGAHLASATADFGGGPRTTPGAPHDELPVIAVYDGSGSYRWDREYYVGTSEGLAPAYLAFNASGTLVHSSPFSLLGGGSGLLVGAYDATGTSLWSNDYTDLFGAILFASGVGIDTTGGVHFRAVTQGTHDFGGGAVSNPVVQLDAAGHYVSSKSLINTLTVYDAAGNVYIDAAVPGCGAANATLTKLDPGGNCVWGKALFSGNGMPSWYGVAVDPDGGLLFHAGFATTLDIGCGTVTNADKLGYLIAKLDGAGSCVWQKVFTSPDFDAPAPGLHLTSDGLGDFIVSGSFSGTIDLGGGPITAPSGGGALLAKLDPTGALRWSRMPNHPYFLVAGGTLGDVFVAGGNQGFDLGTGPLLTVSGFVLVKLAP